jgi:hypothetical protein
LPERLPCQLTCAIGLLTAVGVLGRQRCERGATLFAAAPPPRAYGPKPITQISAATKAWRSILRDLRLADFHHARRARKVRSVQCTVGFDETSPNRHLTQCSTNCVKKLFLELGPVWRYGEVVRRT